MSNLTAITLCVLAFLLAAAALMGLVRVLVTARRNARALVVVPAGSQQPGAAPDDAPREAASRAASSPTTIHTRAPQE